MLYCLTIFIFTLVMIFNVVPRYGRSTPLVYISICSLVGSVSVMAIKGFGVAVKLTLGGNNQFTHPSTYVFGIVVVSCILVQMNYFNKALDTFSTNVYVRPARTLDDPHSQSSSVNPMYYVGFSTATIVASLILFQGFNTTDGTNTMTLLAGFIVTFLGVHLLNLSRKPELPTANGHSALEGGLMNPRMSLQGRPSLDGWGGTSELRSDGIPHSAGHGRRSSLYRAQSNTLFDAFEEGGGVASMPLSQLRESEEEDEVGGMEDDSDVDERTRLHSEHRVRPSVSRSHSNSPAALQGSARASPRTS